MEIKATGLPETIEDYQVALNAAFAGGKAYGLAQRTWVGLTNDEVNNFAAGCHLAKSVQGAIYEAEAKLKEKNT